MPVKEELTIQECPNLSIYVCSPQAHQQQLLPPVQRQHQLLQLPQQQLRQLLVVGEKEDGGSRIGFLNQRSILRIAPGSVGSNVSKNAKKLQLAPGGNLSISSKAAGITLETMSQL